MSIAPFHAQRVIVVADTSKTYWVYVLQSETTGKRYTGQTEDLTRRISQHNSSNEKLNRYTHKHTGPWELIHKEEYETIAEAMNREHWLI